MSGSRRNHYLAIALPQSKHTLLHHEDTVLWQNWGIDSFLQTYKIGAKLSWIGIKNVSSFVSCMILPAIRRRKYFVLRFHFSSVITRT